MMRWLTGVAAGVCAAIAILAAAYGVNQLNDRHAHREVMLGHIASLEADPGYPNRDASIRSEREQLEILESETRKNVLISAIALALALAAFVPLWRRAARSFGALRLAVLVTVTAVAVIAALGLLIVMLSAGAIRG
jgi:hypothetical protein